jgi:hypothetical protein
VILGVAVWPLWGALWLAGSAPHVGWALVAHLALVVPGGFLLRRHRPAGVQRELGKRVGEILIALGVLAWVPYFYVTEYQARDVSSTPFLVWHLFGVIPGALLRYTRLGRMLFRPRQPAP